MKVVTKAKSKGLKAKSKADNLRQLRENAANAVDAAPAAGTGEQAAAEAPAAETTTAIADPKVDILPVLTEEEKKIKAQEEDKRFRELEAASRKTFAEMAFILRDFKAYELWRYVERTGKQEGKTGFKNFDAWLSDASPLGRSSGYAALRAVEKLLPLIPKKELETMPRYSMELLAKVPKVKLDNPTIRKRLVDAAKTETREQLTDTVNKVAPEAHVEQKKNIRIDVSAADNAIGDAFQAARDMFECDTDAEALEVICVDFLDSLCNLEQYAGKNNRAAWEQWKRDHKAEKVGQEIAEMQSKPAPSDAA